VSEKLTTFAEPNQDALVAKYHELYQEGVLTERVEQNSPDVRVEPILAHFAQ
jgi:hypothetical protein